MAGLLDLSPDDTSSTIFTLKEVRSENGREIAVIGVSAGVIKAHPRGFNVEMSLEGSWQIDVASGAELKIDLTGKCNVTVAPPKRRKDRPAAVPVDREVTGEGTLEIHRVARLLTPHPTPPATGDATATTPTN